MPFDRGLGREAWHVLGQHGMALHNYMVNRSVSYVAHPALYAERARRAELDCRAVLAAALAVLNELRDTGQGERAFRELWRNTEKVDGLDLASTVRQAASMMRDQSPQFPIDLLDVLPSYLSELPTIVGVTPAANGLDVETTQGDVANRYSVQLVPASPRVSLLDFFGTGPNRMYAPTNVAATRPSMDWYGASLGAMTFSREWAYRNARIAAELGPPVVRAGGVAAIAIALIIASLAGTAIIVGCDNNLLHGGVCTLGNILFYGSLIIIAGLNIAAAGVAVATGTTNFNIGGVDVTIGANPAAQ